MMPTITERPTPKMPNPVDRTGEMFALVDSKDCVVKQKADGSLAVILKIDAQTAKRHMSRAGTMDLDRYLWENIFKRAIVDSVF